MTAHENDTGRTSRLSPAAGLRQSVRPMPRPLRELEGARDGDCAARITAAAGRGEIKGGAMKMPPGRQLRACSVCGIPTAGYYCRDCVETMPGAFAPPVARPYNLPEYQANRRTVLAEEKTCWLCGGEFRREDPATIDHVVPVRAGGSSRRCNLHAAHRRCNSSRGA